MNDYPTRRLRIQELPRFLAFFAMNPIQTMRGEIALSWPTALSLQAGAAIVSGALVGASTRNFWDFLVGLVIFPITSILSGTIFTFFLYFFFSVFRSTFIDLRRLYSVVALSMMPYFLLHTFSGFLPPLDLIGFAFTSLLLIVGLIEQFGLEKRIVIQLVGGLATVFLVIWAAAMMGIV